MIITTFHVADRGAGTPFTAEVLRKLSLESPTTLVVEVTRGGVLGGPASTTRSIYRKGGLAHCYDGIFALNFLARAASVVSHLISRSDPVRNRSVHVGGRVEKSIL